MKKPEADISQSAHIKKHTKGTSNEVSFSVLDARSGDHDGAAPGLGDIKIESSDEVAGAALGKKRRLPSLRLPFGAARPAQGRQPSAPEAAAHGGPAREGRADDAAARTPHASAETAAKGKRKAARAKKAKKPAAKGGLNPESAPRHSAALSPARSGGHASHAGRGRLAGLEARKKAQPKPSKEKPRRTPEEEVAWRRKRRRLMKLASACAGIVALAALLAVAAWYGVGAYQSRQDTMGDLDRAIVLINQADEPLLALDEYVSDPRDGVTSSSTGAVEGDDGFERESEEGAAKSVLKVSGKTISVDVTALRDAREAVEDAKGTLEEARQKAEDAGMALAQANDQQNQEVANQAVAAINAREDMMDAAFAITEPVQRVAECAEVADAGWAKVIEGDELARESSKALGNGTVEEVQASKEKTEAAVAAFEKASFILGQAQDLYEGADLSPFISYLDKRKEAMAHAIASDDALIARDKQAAQEANASYEQSDQEATALAAELPESPSESVYAAYEQAMEGVKEQYEAARRQAGSADAVLRDYLGVQG